MQWITNVPHLGFGLAAETLGSLLRLLRTVVRSGLSGEPLGSVLNKPVK